MARAKKPDPKLVVCMDWKECARYLFEKHGKNIRNWNGSKEYKDRQDFWHWVCQVKNPVPGGFFNLNRDDDGLMNKDWQKEVLGLFFEEFGEEDYIRFIWF